MVFLYCGFFIPLYHVSLSLCHGIQGQKSCAGKAKVKELVSEGAIKLSVYLPLSTLMVGHYHMTRVYCDNCKIWPVK
jgi:hypothetical protein